VDYTTLFYLVYCIFLINKKPSPKKTFHLDYMVLEKGILRLTAAWCRYARLSEPRPIV